MATETWRISAAGTWIIGVNWMDGAAPMAGDDVSLVELGRHTVTPVKDADLHVRSQDI